MEIIKFDKFNKHMDAILARYDDIYAIESEIDSKLVYGFSDKSTALITPYGLVREQNTRLQTFISLLRDDIAEEVIFIIDGLPPSLREREGIEIMNKPKNPCYGCTGRKIGCHSACKGNPAMDNYTYEQYAADMEAFNDLVHKNKYNEFDVAGYFTEKSRSRGGKDRGQR